MLSNFGIEAGKRTAIYVRISTNQHKTDRQVVELMDFAERSRIDVKPEDVFINITSGFKEGEIRPQYSILKQKAEEGDYHQILFSEFTFYEPDPATPLPTHLREGRKLLQDFSVQADDLRIIDEAQFRRVNEMVTEKAFNRNLGVRHVNLLKDLMHCGECGGHYSVSGGTAERKYRCYGTVNRLDKPKTCDKGTEIRIILR